MYSISVDFIMTFYTRRYNIEPMLTSITKIMMIFFGLLGAIIAFQSIWSRYLSSPDCVIYSISCFSHFGMPVLIMFLNYMISNFEFFALPITLYYSSTLFALAVFFANFLRTGFAITVMAIILVKFRKRLDVFAFVASFCYDWFRHCFSPIQKSLCLEPVVGYIPIAGLFNYMQVRKTIK